MRVAALEGGAPAHVVASVVLCSVPVMSACVSTCAGVQRAPPPKCMLLARDVPMHPVLADAQAPSSPALKHGSTCPAGSYRLITNRALRGRRRAARARRDRQPRGAGQAAGGAGPGFQRRPRRGRRRGQGGPRGVTPPEQAGPGAGRGRVLARGARRGARVAHRGGPHARSVHAVRPSPARTWAPPAMVPSLQRTCTTTAAFGAGAGVLSVLRQHARGACRSMADPLLHVCRVLAKWSLAWLVHMRTSDCVVLDVRIHHPCIALLWLLSLSSTTPSLLD